MLTFTVNSGKLQVTDPCYDMDVWCAYTLENVRNGKYVADIKRENQGVWGDRISELTIKHESVLSKKRLRFRRLDVNIGVDSGQAGFFDHAYYNNIKINEQLDSTFYDQMCEFTLSADQVGSNEHGVVSSSGFGDGVYSLQVAEENGEVVAARIVFIDEESDNL
jgi:hypothetical protein